MWDSIANHYDMSQSVQDIGNAVGKRSVRFAQPENRISEASRDGSRVLDTSEIMVDEGQMESSFW
jgi:hypothetical protein